MLLLIKYTLLYGIVLMLVALGGMFSEHSGVINIALEGIMVVGGLAGVLVTASLPTTMAPALMWQQRSAACFTRCCWRLLPST